MSEFSPRVPLDLYSHKVKPGDQVDTSPDREPLWCTVERVGTHAEDLANVDACIGVCVVVFFFVPVDDCPPLHVREGVELFTRFPVGGAR
jgi:hypothetical protein